MMGPLRVGRRTGLFLALAALAPGCARVGDASGGEPEGAAAPAAGAAEVEVEVRGVTGWYDLGDYRISGEVVNRLDVPVYDVELDVAFRDAAGAVVATDHAAAVLGRVEPGGTAPFVDMHYGAPAGIAGHTVTVAGWSREGRPPRRPVTILSADLARGITGAVVTGRGRNDSGRPLGGIKLVTSFRDRDGKVVGVFFDYPVLGSLQPGQTFDFTVETMDATVADDAVRVQGEGTAGS
ncbi:MAG TPA: FxLYD domain-containing protein [Longimicrobiaceae bacterium]|nr:FxLYD domain-containing protein [Longimicrobiaceae bacterium]